MGRKMINPKEQFSKWLAKSGAIYWIVFNSALLLLMYLRPEVAIACVYMAIIVSVVMIFHVWAYTKNSTYEKGMLALIDKTRMELSLKSNGKISMRQEENPDEPEEEPYNEEEGGEG